MNWRRTGYGEYPEDNQECLIYFQETGLSKSCFSWEFEGGNKCAVFYDK